MVGGTNSFKLNPTKYQSNRDSQRPKKPLNLLQKLYLRETTEYGHHLMLFNKLPRRLAFRLTDLVSDSVLHSGHVFLGFSKDGQFVISYTLQVEAELPTSFPVYVYKLQWWRFVPYQRLKQVSEVRLFGDNGISEDLYIAVCQWPSDELKVLVYGYCTSEPRDQQLCECFITVTAIPTPGPCSDCDQLRGLAEGPYDASFCCLKHGFTIHTKYHLVPPFPKFAPMISLKIDGAVIINTGDSLVVLAVHLNEDSCKAINGVIAVSSPPEGGDVVPQSSPLSVRSEAISGCSLRSSPNSGLVSPTTINLSSFKNAQCQDSETGSCDISESDRLQCSDSLCNNGNYEEQESDLRRACCLESHKIAASMKSVKHESPAHSFSSEPSQVQTTTLTIPPLPDASLSSGISTVTSDSSAVISNVYVVSLSALSPSHRSVSLLKRSCTSPEVPTLKRIAVDMEQNVDLSKEGDDIKYLSATCDVKKQFRTQSGHAHFFAEKSSPTNLSGAKSLLDLNSSFSRDHINFCCSSESKSQDLTLNLRDRLASDQTLSSFELSRASVEIPEASQDSRHLKSDLGFQVESPKSSDCLNALPQAMLYPHQSVEESNNDIYMFVDSSTHTSAVHISCDESAKENISPHLHCVWDANVDGTDESKVNRDHARLVDIVNVNKKSNDIQPNSEVTIDSSVNNAPPLHSCVISLERIFVEKIDNQESSEEDDDIGTSSYHNCLPLEVHGTAYLQMQCTSSNGYKKVVGDSVVVRQQTFDVEQFVHEVAQRLCSDAGKLYLAVYDYDIQLVDVFPETGDAIVVAMMLIKATMKGKSQTKIPRFLNNVCKKVYETGFTFVWNIASGSYSILETEALVEQETEWKEKQPVHQWNPGYFICQQMQKKWFIPQPRMKSVSVLTNEAVLKGSPLKIIQAPYPHHIALTL